MVARGYGEDGSAANGARRAVAVCLAGFDRKVFQVRGAGVANAKSKPWGWGRLEYRTLPCRKQHLR